MSESKPQKTYWLDRKENVSKVYYVLCGVCVALFLGDALYHKHVHFDIEGWFGFYALYGGLGAWLLVETAKQMRKLLKRDEDYYER